MNKKDIYLLTKINGIGPKAIRLIVEAFSNTPHQNINPSNYEEFLSFKGMKRYQKPLIDTFSSDKYHQFVDEMESELEFLDKSGVELVSITDPTYPVLLRLIEDPPPLLYLQGNSTLLYQGIGCAVVGSRDHTERGKVITEKTVDFLCKHDYTIVSGLARGIDSAAHHQTLDNQQKTIAVLVDSLNIHPRTNTQLAENILKNSGLLVAENYPGVSILPQLFAKRDRIQTGLSAAVFAIETSKTGGTRHAIEQAIKNNRLIFVPDFEKSGYPDTSITQLEGLKHYCSIGAAEKYTKHSYEKIVSKINDKYTELTN